MFKGEISEKDYNKLGNKLANVTKMSIKAEKKKETQKKLPKGVTYV
jgi:hypothetical protein